MILEGGGLDILVFYHAYVLRKCDFRGCWSTTHALNKRRRSKNAQMGEQPLKARRVVWHCIITFKEAVPTPRVGYSHVLLSGM